MFKSRKAIISIAAALVLLLATMPAAALAAAGDVTGSVTVTNSQPVLGTPTLTGMTPDASNTLTVGVTDANTLNDITQIDVVIALDTDGASGADGALDGANTPRVWDLATFKWTPGGGFAIVGSDVGWAISGTVPADLTTTSGNFIFTITPSEIARYAAGGNVEGTLGWDVYIKVNDGTDIDEDGPKGTQGSVPKTLVDLSMSAYASIGVSDSGAVSFGSLGVGASDQPLTAPVGSYDTYTVSNKVYDLKINSGNWAGGGSGTLTLDSSGGVLAADTFSIKVDKDTLAGAAYVAVSAITLADYDDVGASTVESPSDISNTKKISLWASLASVITYAETYSGTIAMTLVQG